MTHSDCMSHALTLAQQGRFGAHPNPMVGAVLVQKGEIVGEGYHARYGGPHAEVEALRQAGEKARGADLYVTLEPCRHWGKTPPCTEALIQAGVARVFFGAEDPHQEVSGGGAEILRKAGLEVQKGLLGQECRELIRTFQKRVQTGIPWVTLKVGMTLDGKIATRTRVSRWITDAASRQLVHEKRAEVDAILTGVGTVLADDPMLDARLETTQESIRQPHRIILDPEGLTPMDCRIVRSAGSQPTTLVISDQLPQEKVEPYHQMGIEILRLPVEAGRMNLAQLLRWCAAKPMNEVLIEAGSFLAGSAYDIKVIDSVLFFIAPRLIGGEGAPGVLGGMGVENLEGAARIKNWKVRSIGPDVLIEGDVEYPE